jgi:hypothetical protein
VTGRSRGCRRGCRFFAGSEWAATGVERAGQGYGTANGEVVLGLVGFVAFADSQRHEKEGLSILVPGTMEGGKETCGRTGSSSLEGGHVLSAVFGPPRILISKLAFRHLTGPVGCIGGIDL